MAHSNIELICERDEQWSYVGHKKQPRWLWYAWQPHLKTVLAYEAPERMKPWNASYACFNLSISGSIVPIVGKPTDANYPLTYTWLANVTLNLSNDNILILGLDSSGWLAERYVFPSRLRFMIRSLASSLIACFSTLLNHDPISDCGALRLN